MYEDKVVCMFVVALNYAGRPLRRRSCFLPFLVRIRSLTRRTGQHDSVGPSRRTVICYTQWHFPVHCAITALLGLRCIWCIRCIRCHVSVQIVTQPSFSSTVPGRWLSITAAGLRQ